MENLHATRMHRFARSMHRNRRNHRQTHQLHRIEPVSHHCGRFADLIAVVAFVVVVLVVVLDLVQALFGIVCIFDIASVCRIDSLPGTRVVHNIAALVGLVNFHLTLKRHRKLCETIGEKWKHAVQSAISIISFL